MSSLKRAVGRTVLRGSATGAGAVTTVAAFFLTVGFGEAFGCVEVPEVDGRFRGVDVDLVVRVGLAALDGDLRRVVWGLAGFRGTMRSSSVVIT